VTSFKDINERARVRARGRARGVAKNARAIAKNVPGLPLAILGVIELLADTIDELIAVSEAQEGA
jgi:hypothetical protein